MNIDTFLGNEGVKAALRTQLQNDTLAHSILLCGEQGCGTGAFARLLAADILYPDNAAGVHRVLQGADPDCIETQGEGTSGMFKVDTVREARLRSTETSLSNSHRVLIFYEAQNFNPASANALLKILEEPPEGVFFIITVSDAAVVLPTVRSRCAIYQLQAPAVKECEDFLRQKGVDAASAHRLAAVWDGRIGSALACASGARRNGFETALLLCELIAGHDTYGMMKLFVPYEKNKDNLYPMLEDAMQILRGALEGKAGADTGGVSLEQAVAVLPCLTKTYFALKGNGNVKLLLTQLSLQLTA